jgi:alpha-beta hydrolase superfamily lysophospholipase
MTHVEGWARSPDGLKAQTATVRGAPAPRVPALVMQPGAGRLAEPAARRRWAAVAPQELATYVEWDGPYHEMFEVPVQERVFSRMATWLAATCQARRRD